MDLHALFNPLIDAAVAEATGIPAYFKGIVSGLLPIVFIVSLFFGLIGRLFRGHPRGGLL